MPTRSDPPNGVVTSARGPRSSRRPVRLVPINGRELLRQAGDDLSYVIWRRERHSVLASMYGLYDTIARVAIAIAAALSAVTVIADSLAWATALSIVTAVLSAVNATVKPGETAERHWKTARAFDAAVRSLGDVVSQARAKMGAAEPPETAYDSTTGRYYDAANPDVQELDRHDLQVLVAGYRQCRLDIEASESGAPNLYRFHSADDYEDPDHPMTLVGYLRLRKRLRYEARADKALARGYARWLASTARWKRLHDEAVADGVEGPVEMEVRAR
jgi:hypothetical protein